MQKYKCLIAVLGLVAAGVGSAQVLSPPEILDPQLRELQRKHLADLKHIATDIAAHSFPYRLYFSRALDLDEARQQGDDQRSIRFDKFHDQTVLEITANYYASYSADLMQQEDRARRTLLDVIAPMLQAAVTALPSEDEVQAFAFEVAHHVRRKVLGVSNETAENVAFILPARAARQLLAAATPGEREATLMQGQLFVNRRPLEGWGNTVVQLASERSASAPPRPSTPVLLAVVPPKPPAAMAAIPPAHLAAPKPDVSGGSLQALQAAHQPDLDRLLREVNTQAHFVSYAPPAFVAFHGGAYLQLSMRTLLRETAAGSQYQMASLAFDEHIAHLIRPVLAVLQGCPDFAGVDFSTSVRAAGSPEDAGVAVEFIFTSEMLNRYQNFDLTGQQLIDAGYVLINGERVGLDLQRAEVITTRR